MVNNIIKKKEEGIVIKKFNFNFNGFGSEGFPFWSDKIRKTAMNKKKKTSSVISGKKLKET